nr:hypothetical protein [Tanacetum cinerariifolium]
ADESLAKHKALELEIKRLLRAVVSQDIMFVVQKASVVDTSNLQTELERTKERFETVSLKRRMNMLNFGMIGHKSGTSANTKFAKQSIVENLPKVGETYALSKPVTSNSVPTPQESKFVKNDKQCLISVNHDVCLRNYVNGKTSRGKKQTTNVSIKEKQKKHQPKVKKTKKVRFIERLATPEPRKSRFFLRWSPTGRLFDIKGKIIESSESESQSDCSNGDNACTSNTLEPKIKRFPNSTSLLGRLSRFVYGFLLHQEQLIITNHKNDPSISFHITFAMSAQQDIYAAGFKNRPPMLNKDNYVSWSSRLLHYEKSKPNGKLFVNSIKNVLYVRRMIHEPDDPNNVPPVAESTHEQTNDELTEKEMMKGSSIGVHEKKAKLFNEWEMFTLTEGESIESYYHPQILGIQNVRNHNGIIVVPRIANANVNPNGHGNVVEAWDEGNGNGNNVLVFDFSKRRSMHPTTEFDLMAVVGDIDEIKKVNASYILMENLQQASTSCTQTNKALIYDSDGSAELLEPITEPHAVQQNNSTIISVESSVEHNRGTLEQYLATVEETRAYFESLYNNLVTEVEKVNTVKDTIVTLQSVIKHRMNANMKNWSSPAYQEFHKIIKDEIAPIVNQVDARVQNFKNHFVKKAAKFVRDFKSLAKAAGKSLDKITVLEKENERLLRAVGSQDIMSIMHNPSIVKTFNLQTVLSKFVKSNDKVIALEMFRIDPFKTFRKENCVPINKARASIRTNLITLSQPHVITKKDVNSVSNSLSST